MAGFAEILAEVESAPPASSASAPPVLPVEKIVAAHSVATHRDDDRLRSVTAAYRGLRLRSKLRRAGARGGCRAAATGARDAFRGRVRPRTSFTRHAESAPPKDGVATASRSRRRHGLRRRENNGALQCDDRYGDRSMPAALRPRRRHWKSDRVGNRAARNSLNARE